jgi:MoaA/NifB/PqqE/SkfB family radical SAM enzyme
MWSNLGKKLSIFLNGFSFYLKFIDDIYERHLGHNKVIGFEKGKPVHSLLMPALLSDQYRNFLTGMVFEVLLNVRIPFGVNLAITDRCNSHCEHCIFKIMKKNIPAMNLKEISNCIHECQELGLTTMNLLGGEPLMHEDIIPIVRMVDKRKINLLLFTNGSLLAEMASDLRKAGLRRVMVSIDFPEPEKHDTFRRQAGLFARAIKGIGQAGRKGMLVGLSTTINARTTLDDLSNLFELGKTLKICEIFISKEYNPDRGAFFQDRLEDGFYDLVKKINGDKRYPFGIFYYPFFNEVSFGCTAGATRLYISPYGEVTPCDCTRKSFGNIRTEGLRTIWERMYRSPQLGYVTRDGCRAGRGVI